MGPESRGPSDAPEVPWDRNEETPVVQDPRALLGLPPEPAAAPPPAPSGPRAPARRESGPPRQGAGKRPAPRPPEGSAAAARGDAGQRADPVDPPAFLFVEKGPGAGQLVPMRQGTLVIGRGSTSDLRLVHPSISRKHAAVTREGQQFFIRDFGSQNGTFVNQRRCPPELELFPGDEIAVGNAVLRLRSRADRNDAPRVRRGAAGAAGGDARSSRSLRWMVLVAATSVGLVGALGWALLHQPEIGPIMEPAPGAAPPASEANGVRAPASRPERAEPRVAAKTAPPAPTASPADVKPPSARELAAPPPASALLEREATVPAGPPASPREERVPRRAEAAAPPTAPRPALAPRTPPPPAKETRLTRPPAAEAERPPEPSGTTVAAPKNTAPERTPPPSTPPPEPRPASGPPPPAILAAYEAGDVAGALSRARSGDHSELAGRLERFQLAYEGGKQALAKKDGNGAIRQFVLAAKLDEGISKGWGVYGPELRARLTRLYVAAGAQKARAGDAEGARKAYQAALQYDASNVEARSGLDALGNAGR